MEILPPRSPEELAVERRRHDESRAERWPIVIGLVGTVVFHLAAYFGAMRIPFGGFEPPPGDIASMREKYEKQELTFLLADDQPPPQPKRFVEVNPDAPENDPGATDNFGARNQQAAQPEPGRDNSDRAKTIGEVDESTAVVTGMRQTPAEPTPMSGAEGQRGAGMTAVVVGSPNQPKAAEPLPGFEKFSGENPEGLGTNLGRKNDGKADDEKSQEGKDDGEGSRQLLAVSGGGVPGAPGRPAPRPRPKLQNVRPAVLANQPLSASSLGVPAVSSRLSEAGIWWDEFIGTIDGQFQKLAAEMSTHPPARSQVTIHFMVNTKGEIRVLDVGGEETAGRVATLTCLDAIRARAPYRPWTQDMIALFGDEEEVLFTFFFR